MTTLTQVFRNNEARDNNTRHSISGYLFIFNNSPISWFLKLQKTTALSLCEGEYIALKEAIKEYLQLKSMLSQLKINKLNI